MARPQTAAAPKHPPAPRGRDNEPLVDAIAWDDEFPALGLRNRFGKGSWIVQARIGGRSTRRTLGAASFLTREAARQAAAAVLDALRAEQAEAAISPDTTVAAFVQG